MRSIHTTEQMTDYLRDESRSTGEAEEVYFPASEEDVIRILRQYPHKTITVQGSRTGLTAGAVPQGGIVLNMSRMNRILSDLQTGSDFRVVNTVLRYIGDHYTEPITLTDLAQTVYLSTHYLCRLFKQVIGTSPMEYVANLRMTKAKELLIQGLSVEQTCERVGYGNLSHFSRQFRQKVGMSPRQYIALNRPK